MNALVPGTLIEVRPAFDAEGVELDDYGHSAGEVLETTQGRDVLVMVQARGEVWLPAHRLRPLYRRPE